MDCCRKKDNLSNNSHGGAVGEWYFPNGSMVPRFGSNSPFYRIGGPHQVRLARANTTLPVPLGIYRCEVPDGIDGIIYNVSIIISVVGQNAHAELRGQTRACSKSVWDTRVIRYNYYARAALAWTKKKRSLRNDKLKANRASVIEEPSRYKIYGRTEERNADDKTRK